MSGDSGADSFHFKADNAIITGYTTGSDKIYLQGTSVTKTEVNGKNVIFTTSADTITVKNDKNIYYHCEKEYGLFPLICLKGGFFMMSFRGYVSLWVKYFVLSNNRRDLPRRSQHEN